MKRAYFFSHMLQDFSCCLSSWFCQSALVAAIRNRQFTGLFFPCLAGWKKALPLGSGLDFDTALVVDTEYSSIDGRMY